MVRTQHTPSLVVRLLLWYVATLIGITILQFILGELIDIGSSSGGWMATILAAMVPGDIYFRRTGELPSQGFGWRMAIGFALSSICLTALQAAVSISLGNALTLELVGNLQFLLLLLFLHVIGIGPLKWCFGWGASSRQRAFAKKAAKALSTEQQNSRT